MKFDAYQMVTDRIVELLEQGIKPWAKPWSSAMTCAWSGNDGRVYSLLNQMLLADPEKKYQSMQEWLDDISGEWVTFKQAQDRGGCVRKGEHGRKVVFFKMIEKPKAGSTTGEVESFPYLTAYTVFKVSQCDGISQKFHVDSDKVYDFQQDATADDIIDDYLKREGITYNQVRGNKAYYSPPLDLIVTPLPEQFENNAEFYSTIFHEMTHSTGHKDRLNRINTSAAFGECDYSKEELIAEIGSASILATLGIENPDSFNNSVAYINNWLRALKNDKKLIVSASAAAEKAIRRILNIKE